MLIAIGDLIEGIAFLVHLVLRGVLAVARIFEFLLHLNDLGDLIARGWRRLRGNQEKSK